MATEHWCLVCAHILSPDDCKHIVCSSPHCNVNLLLFLDVLLLSLFDSDWEYLSHYPLLCSISHCLNNIHGVHIILQLLVDILDNAFLKPMLFCEKFDRC